MTNSDSHLQFASSPSHHLFTAATTHQNHRKKRSKLILIDSTTPAPASSGSTISKPKYGKKPDPGAPKITRPCSECGKKFWSWKALFGHMRCHPERQWRGINPPPNLQRPVAMSSVNGFNDLEKVMEGEDHEVAASLLILANGPSAVLEVRCSATSQGVQDSDIFIREETTVGVDVDNAGTSSGGSCRFECSSCKKVFGSHQALGGHRASHKNVKGCFAITRSDSEVENHNDDEGDRGEVVAKENNVEEKMLMVLGVHKCSICLRVFSSGQALGGHKRCHWEKGDDPSLNQGLSPSVTKECCDLDLNLPAPMEVDSCSTSYSSGLILDLRLGL